MNGQIPQWITELIAAGEARKRRDLERPAGPRVLPGVPELPGAERIPGTAQGVLELPPSPPPSIGRSEGLRSPDHAGGYSGGARRFPQPVPPEVAAQLDAKEAAGQAEGVTGAIGDEDFMGPRIDPEELFRRQAGGTEDTGFRTPGGGGYAGADLSGATLGPNAREEPVAAPGGPPGQQGETLDERRLRLMTAARKFREAGSQFRNITGESEMWLRKGNVPDRSVRDEDARAAEERQRGIIEEQRRGDPHNPDSQMSIAAREIYRRMTGKEAPQTLTAAQVGAFSPMLQKILQGDVTGEGNRLQAAAALDRSRRAGRAEDRAVRKEEREEAEFTRDQGDPAAVSGGDMTKLPAEARDELNKDRRAFYNNARMNELKGMSEAARSIKSRIQASETFGPASAFRALARSAGETGVMTDKDIADFSSRLGRLGIYDKGYQLVAGKISPELEKEIFAVADAFAAAADTAIDSELQPRISSLRQQYPYIQEGTLREFFMPGAADETLPSGEDAGAAEGTGGAGGPDDEVWVRRGDQTKVTNRANAERLLREQKIDEIID